MIRILSECALLYRGPRNSGGATGIVVFPGPEEEGNHCDQDDCSCSPGRSHLQACRESDPTDHDIQSCEHQSVSHSFQVDTAHWSDCEGSDERSILKKEDRQGRACINHCHCYLWARVINAKDHHRCRGRRGGQEVSHSLSSGLASHRRHPGIGSKASRLRSSSIPR